MRVELLWWEGCPSWEQALGDLREQLRRLGLDPDQVDVREIGDQRDAERERFVGSPTIRIDGRDVDPPADEPAGLTCRVYRLRNGRYSALPDPEDVRQALVAAIEGGDDGRS